MLTNLMYVIRSFSIIYIIIYKIWAGKNRMLSWRLYNISKYWTWSLSETIISSAILQGTLFAYFIVNLICKTIIYLFLWRMQNYNFICIWSYLFEYKGNSFQDSNTFFNSSISIPSFLMTSQIRACAQSKYSAFPCLQ